LWLSADNYSLEIDDITARVRWRKVRTGHVRYLREFGSKFLQGPRLELSERGPLGARFFGGVVVVPKGLPDYEQIKKQVSTWMAEAESHTEK
jgi:hypothetical protein